MLRVGAQQPTPVDVRLVAASSVDLAQAVAAGKFSERLYRYLDEGRLELPALRERPGDILPLAEYFLGVYAQRLGLDLPQLGADAQLALERYAWPGNTRELESVVHFALLVCSGDEILPAHLNLPGAAAPSHAPLTIIEEQLARLDARERAQLQALLARTGACLQDRAAGDRATPG